MGVDPDRVCCNAIRGTGITAYFENGGKLEVAQHIAGHATVTLEQLLDLLVIDRNLKGGHRQ